MKKRKKKLKLKKIFLLLILVFLFYFLNQKSPHDSLLHQTQNSNYAGIGQKEVQGKDGYFTISTLTASIYPMNQSWRIYKPIDQF